MALEPGTSVGSTSWRSELTGVGRWKNIQRRNLAVRRGFRCIRVLIRRQWEISAKWLGTLTVWQGAQTAGRRRIASLVVRSYRFFGPQYGSSLRIEDPLELSPKPF